MHGIFPDLAQFKTVFLLTSRYLATASGLTTGPTDFTTPLLFMDRP